MHSSGALLGICRPRTSPGSSLTSSESGETGDRKHAEQLFDRGVPFVMWSMQSIDHSVTAAKVELHRRGVIASPRLRQPALAPDEIACGQLSRFLDRRLADSG